MFNNMEPSLPIKRPQDYKSPMFKEKLHTKVFTVLSARHRFCQIISAVFNLESGVNIEVTKL